MKNTRLIFGLLAIMLCGCAVRAPQARAQFIGYVSPQTVQQTLAPAGTACTGSAQNFNVANLGQTQHIASLIASGTQNKMSIEIDGLDVSGNVFRLSDTGIGNFGTTGTSLSAAGYFPIVRVSVTCTGSSFTLTYAGTSATAPVNAGVFLGTQVNKNLFFGLPANTLQSSTFQTPFANSSGTILFNFNSGAIAGSSIALQCQSFVSGSVFEQFTFPLANATGVQVFKVPPASCPTMQASYQTGGATSGTFALEYIFDPSGAAINPTLASYTHITGTTATAVKATQGTLLGINLNTSGAGTISVFDLATAACTGTPSTNTVAVLTIAATENARAIPFNQFLLNGICVKASAAMDFTVGSQ